MEGHPLLQDATKDAKATAPFEAKSGSFGLNAEVCVFFRSCFCLFVSVCH